MGIISLVKNARKSYVRIVVPNDAMIVTKNIAKIVLVIIFVSTILIERSQLKLLIALISVRIVRIEKMDLILLILVYLLNLQDLRKNFLKITAVGIFVINA
jgi:hypothetical protein